MNNKVAVILLGIFIAICIIVMIVRIMSISP